MLIFLLLVLTLLSRLGPILTKKVLNASQISAPLLTNCSFGISNCLMSVLYFFVFFQDCINGLPCFSRIVFMNE